MPASKASAIFSIGLNRSDKMDRLHHHFSLRTLRRSPVDYWHLRDTGVWQGKRMLKGNRLSPRATTLSQPGSHAREHYGSDILHMCSYSISLNLIFLPSCTEDTIRIFLCLSQS